MVIYCDNVTTVQVINTLKSHSDRMLSLMREIAFVCAQANVEIKAVHIAGQDNWLPDWLSRWDESPQCREAFKAWNLRHELQQVKITADVWEVSSDW